MSKFRTIVENILKEKKLSQQEIDKHMRDVDDDDPYWKNDNKSNEEEDEYNWEEDEKERRKRDEELMKKPLHLTQSDIEELLLPCIGSRSDVIYIPVRNNKGEIHIYNLDSDYIYKRKNKKPLQELSTEEVLDIVSRNKHDFTPEELYWFVHTPGSYDEGYDVKDQYPDEGLLHVSKVLQDVENNKGYKETYGIQKLYTIFKNAVIYSRYFQGEYGELADDSGYIIYIDMPKEEREKSEAYKELVDMVNNYRKVANTEKEILKMAPVDGQDRVAILISTDMDKHITRKK